MKSTLTIAALTISLLATAQTIRRVNNTAGISTPYTTIDGAITAAANGDIILVEGSTTDYSLPNNYTLTKSVTILGPGWYLDQNVGLQLDTRSATVDLTGSLILAAGSEGTVISGMVFRDPIEIRVSNITISHNAIYTIVINNSTPASTLWIHGNYLGAFNTAGAPIIFSAGATANTLYTNILISNNFLSWRAVLGTTKVGTFTNNVIVSTVTGAYDLTNFTVTNNIFDGASITTLNLTNALVQNNVFCGSGYYPAFDPGWHNITNINLSDVFSGGTIRDSQYKLKAGSPAIGVGIDGIDAGIFAGPNPYKPSGITEGLPALTKFSAPASTPQNIPLPVKVSANSN